MKRLLEWVDPITWALPYVIAFGLLWQAMGA